jgi:hypothetical protein
MKYKLVDIRQRQLVSFITELKRQQPEEWENQEDLPLPIYYNLFVSAAYVAEWFEEIEPLPDEMKFREAEEVAGAVAKVYVEAIAPDPN